MSVWSPEESGKFKFSLRGWSEPVHCVGLCGGELVTATTGNRIGVHTSLSSNASFTSTKLRSDTIRSLPLTISLDNPLFIPFFRSYRVIILLSLRFLAF